MKMKRGFLLVIFGVMLVVAGRTQSMYSVLNNRVLFSTLVNNDTLLIENLNNEVRFHGELGLLEVTYHNLDARIVNSKPGEHLKSDITIKFWNEYQWLDERIKIPQGSMEFTDELYVDVGGEEELIMADFRITRVRAGQGFVVMMEIQGDVSPEPLKQEFPDLMFRKDLHFKILLTVQVTH